MKLNQATEKFKPAPEDFIDCFLLIYICALTQKIEMTFPDLNSARLRLRSIIPADQEAIFNGLSNPDVVKYYGISFRNYEDTNVQMLWYKRMEHDRTGKWWAICLQGTTELIGTAGIYNIEKNHRKGELGYWLLPGYWHKGYISEAVKLIIDFSFNSLNLHRIEATVETENIASIKTLLKLGFHLEGTQRESEWKANRWIDLHQFALLHEI
ncbi:MAG: GNAT family N-acetyltransferase [Bacteroidia bacterium]|nr:GNAT family N-acetyltransferase [Bacteroidia bacterium]MCZ2277114.1 GNAT family N-acetyltransferase [Bacteroidia bacterium]